MNLNIKRCSNSKRVCVFPSCNEKNGLKYVPKGIRYCVLYRSGVYLPFRTLACRNHLIESAWLNVANLITQNEFEYNQEQIQDMFRLLLDKSTAQKIPGILSRFKLFVLINSS